MDESTPTDDPRLDKIRKLLAKAEQTNHPEEAKTFTAKAYELMEKWAIDEATVVAAGKAAQDATEIKSITIDMQWGPYMSPREQLLMRICTARDCKPIFTSFKRHGERNEVGEYVPFKKPRFQAFANVIGFPRDLEFVTMLYTSCLLQAEMEFRTDNVQSHLFAETSHPGHRIKWRNDFMLGYATTVGTRLWKMRAETKKTADLVPGVALVLADRGKLVERRFVELYPRTYTKQNNAGGSGGSGTGLGREAGSRADLGGPGNRVGGGSKKAVGA